MEKKINILVLAFVLLIVGTGVIGIVGITKLRNIIDRQNKEVFRLKLSLDYQKRNSLWVDTMLSSKKNYCRIFETGTLEYKPFIKEK